MRGWIWATLAIALAVAAPAAAEVAAEPLGQVRKLPATPSPHRVWLADPILRRTALVDLDGGRFLGMLSAGLGNVVPVTGARGAEIYLAETHYSRGTRGRRTDVITIYDARTLAPEAEVEIPAKRAEHFSGVASVALSDDGRFLALFNFTAATSLSIVDVEARRFVTEIETPGCSLVYAAGPRRFLMLCGDGSLLVVALDDAGRAVHKARTARFFDPRSDPVTEKAVRVGDRWLFVSFEGWIHPVRFSEEAIRFEDAWSLFDAAARDEGWRIGGTQHLAAHAASQRLFGLVHRGGPDGHKEPGSEVWVWDLRSRARVQRIPLRNPLALFVEHRLALDPETATGRVVRWLIGKLLPHAGADRLAVTDDPRPLLVATSNSPVTLAVYDAASGRFLRDVAELGVAGGHLGLASPGGGTP